MRARQLSLKALLMASVYVFWTGIVSAETIYVRADFGDIRSGKTSLSKVVARVDYGEALNVLDKVGRWYKVRTSKGVEGWIFANKISTAEPPKSQGRVAALAGFGSFGQTQTSEVTATAGARGLDKVSESYADRTSTITPKDREAVNEMAAYHITEDELTSFLKEGRLGEYAQ